jgi:hypothetical protein
VPEAIRQREVGPERGHAARRQQPQLHREQQQHDDAEPEGRNRDAQHRDRANQPLNGRASRGGDDAERHGDDRRDDQRREHELDGVPNPLAEIAPTGRVL